MQLDSASKEEDLSLMDGEKSLSKMEFHQILERYKAKALGGAGGKPTELTLIPENVSARLDTSAHQSPDISKTIRSPGGMGSVLA